MSRSVAPPSLDDVFASGYSRLVRSVLPFVGGSNAVAEDVVAEAFARAHERWDQVGGYDRPDLWIRRVALNLAISRHRRDGRLEPGGLSGVGEGSVSPETGEVLDAVLGLPERQAQVVVLVYFARESVSEAARILDVSESTARTHLTRALDRLAVDLFAQEDPS